MRIQRKVFEAVKERFPHIHLFGDWYMVRRKPRKFFTLEWILTHVVPTEEASYPNNISKPKPPNE